MPQLMMFLKIVRILRNSQNILLIDTNKGPLINVYQVGLFIAPGVMPVLLDNSFLSNGNIYRAHECKNDNESSVF